MSTKKRITLPEREEMLRRLVAANDEPHYQEGLYPLLLKNAGQQRIAGGVVTMFALAIADYTKDMPGTMRSLVFMSVPDLIDALVDDKEVADEAKAFLAKALDRK